MLTRPRLAVVLCSVLPTCTPPSAAPPATVAIGVPASATAVQSPPALPSASAPAPASSAQPTDSGDIHSVEIELQPGSKPCRFVLHAGVFTDETDSFSAGAITAIATQEGPGCAASVLYDLARETKANPDEMDPEPLEGGTFQKPGRPKADAASDSWNHLEDLNFDGVADLCVVERVGAYNYGQKCWLFDTAARKFVRHTGLDEIIHMTIDPSRKRLAQQMRLGGPQYLRAEYAWIEGKLAPLWQEQVTLGEKPDGTALPGRMWVIRFERKGDKLVRVREGAQKAD